MHNADAALSVALSNMLREPGRYRRNLDAGFRFLALSNTLLGYLSALGAHRAALAGEADPDINRCRQLPAGHPGRDRRRAGAAPGATASR